MRVNINQLIKSRATGTVPAAGTKSIASLADQLKEKGFDISMRNSSFFDCAS
jgi:hypothetical protein